MKNYFNRLEFKCKCGQCDQDTVDYELLEILNRLREWYESPITINSGNRCEAYNKKIGGSKDSQHLRSRAADIVVKGVNPSDVYALLNQWYPNQYGLGSYDTFTHVDPRSYRARW